MSVIIEYFKFIYLEFYKVHNCVCTTVNAKKGDFYITHLVVWVEGEKIEGANAMWGQAREEVVRDEG